MDWLIPIVVLLVVLTVFIIMYKKASCSDEDTWFAAVVITGILLGIALLVFPISQLMTKIEAIEATAYWETFIEPNIVGIDGETVIITGTEPAIWQAGEWNLAHYNTWLASIRWQDSKPVLQWMIFSPPEFLKFARVD